MAYRSPSFSTAIRVTSKHGFSKSADARKCASTGTRAADERRCSCSETRRRTHASNRRWRISEDSAAPFTSFRTVRLVSLAQVNRLPREPSPSIPTSASSSHKTSYYIKTTTPRLRSARAFLFRYSKNKFVLQKFSESYFYLKVRGAFD